MPQTKIRSVTSGLPECGERERRPEEPIHVTLILDGESRRSSAYLIEAQKLSHTGSFGWNVSTGEIFWSEETFRIFDYDLAVRPTVDLILQRVHADDRADVQRIIELASSVRTAVDFEHRLAMPDGATKYIRVVANRPKENPDALEYIGAVTEITAVRQAELHLRRSERSLRLTLEALPGLVWTILPDGRVDFCNERILSYCGKTLEELQDLTCVWHPNEIEAKVQQLKRFLSAGTANEDEFRLLRHDGVYRWHQCRVQPLRDESGEIIRWYGLLWDIEERKRAEEERKKAFDEVKSLRDQLYQENLVLKEEIDEASMFEEIVGSSDALREVLLQVAKVAPTNSTVLIAGETGTGKELVARAIHNRSQRSGRPFVRVNCAAIPQSLIASELFGHEKGAFTGATQRRLGRFELADGGTLFQTRLAIFLKRHRLLC
jgi:PAS domain S-box-containing protein